MLTALAFMRDTVSGLDRVGLSSTPVTSVRVPSVTGMRTVHFATSLEAFEEVLLRRDYKTVITGPYYKYLVANYGPWLLSSTAEQHKTYTPHKHFSNADDFLTYLDGLFPFIERRSASWSVDAVRAVETTDLFHSLTFSAVLGLVFSNALGFGAGPSETPEERSRRALVTRAWHFTRRDMEFFGRTTISLKWLYKSKYAAIREEGYREWDKLIAVLGPDECRYVSRMQAAGFISPDFIRTTMQAVMMFIPFFLVRSLQFSLMMLAENEDVAAKLQADIADVTAEDCSPKFAERAPYLDGFVKEVLRLFPVFYVLDRVALEDQDLLGTRLRQGEQIFLSPYVLHRDQKLWPSPTSFQPERFEGPRPKGYYPFGLGPHMCAGQAFAPAILKALLVLLLRRYRFAPAGIPRIYGGIPGLRFAHEPRFTMTRAAGS